MPDGTRKIWTVMWKRLLILVLAVACDQRPDPPASQGWISFEGTWTASGTRRVLDLGSGGRSAVFDLSGAVLLTSSSRNVTGFRAQAIGFSDGAGLVGRCIWTDERGDKVFSEIKGGSLGAGNRIEGTFVGGTGRFEGVSGEYTLQWQYVLESDDGAIGGRAVGLKGRARIR